MKTSADQSRKSGMGKKLLKIIGIILLIIVVITPISFGFSKGWFAKGNGKAYAPANTASLENSTLSGKTIIFLGSSVTEGSQSGGDSMVEYLTVRDGIIAVEEAVSGTTLADSGENSYIQRMLRIDLSIHADAFVCQLSTNDASQKLPLGEIAEGYALTDFDTSTVTGGMEYIIAYAQETWGCPVVFYTGTRYDSPEYEQMVNRLLALQEKWGIGVIDLWNDEEMNAVSKAEYKLYMFDSIHPTRAGYRDWWTPKFETYLSGVLGQ